MALAPSASLGSVCPSTRRGETHCQIPEPRRVSGARWRDLPSAYGPWESVYNELLHDITDACVAGDKAYDAAPLVERLERKRCTVVIPLARNFLAFLHLAWALVWLV